MSQYQVLYDYSDVPTLKKFALDDSRVRCAMGPFGCLHGDMRVITEQGLVRIADINKPTRVLSWNEKNQKFQLSSASSAFQKGTDYLYQISTRRGDIVAAAHHLVFCADHTYRQVQDLKIGDSLCFVGHSLKGSFSSLKLWLQGASRFVGKSADFLAYYLGSAHLCGLSPHLEACNAQSFSPSQACVQKSAYRGDLCVDGRTDGLVAQSQEHNRRGQPCGQKQNGGCSPHSLRQFLISAGHTFLQFYEHTVGLLPQSLQYRLMSPNHYIKKLSVLFCRSFLSSSISDGNIINIKLRKVKEKYWDIHVCDTHNYVTEDGMIHHNSGKSSACVMEIVRKAHEQVPGPDGIRRSRWAVIRNTYSQLKDTTIRTFHDWYPPKLFGEYRVTDHMYIITKFPNVHLEILFRALDRPDQVSNLLSLEVTGAWFNEVREVPKTIVEAMDARIGRYPSKRDGGASWYGMIMDTNPPDEDSYVYKMFEKTRPEGWKIFKQPSGLSTHAENSKHLPKNYYTNLAKGKDEMYVRVYIHGQYGFIVSGKPVFSSFVDNVHVAPHNLEPQKGLDVIVGFDFGLQPACAIGQITPMGQLRIIDELVSDGMGLRQFCENQLLPLLRRKYFGMNVMGFGDPSGTSRAPTDESTCFEVLHSREIGLSNIEPAPTNAIMPRIAAVELFLNKMYAGEPAFILSPNCHFLRKAMNGGYHYEKQPKGSGEEYKPMPVKNFSSHISDALQMACMYIAERDINKQRWAKFSAQIKTGPYRPMDSITGY